MAGNDTLAGGGRGTGRGISRGRGVRGTTLSSGRGMAATTPSHSIVGQATNPSTSHTTTNTQVPHSTPSPPISQSTSLPQIPSSNASAADPHVSSNDVDSSPNIGSEDPLDNRIWIRPGPESTFDPPIAPTRAITKIMKQKFDGCWTTYGELKAEEKKNGKHSVIAMWFREFNRKFKWLPELDGEIKKSFDHKASQLYSSAMYRVRKGEDDGDWIPVEMRKKLDAKWSEDEWKSKAQTNSKNRKSSDAPLHTGGSIPTFEISKRIKKSPEVTPTSWEIFEYTHKLKGDPSKWVSSKSKDIADEFEKRIIERDSHEEALGDDVSRHESDNIIFLDVVGGVNKKGRIYGLGPIAGKYKPSRSSRSDGILQSEFEQMRAENASLKEKLKAHEELIRASQEDSRFLREQMTKLMEMVSQGHLHPPPPPST